ncbi:MAG: AAA family ATP:ADP antiporter [Chlamydiales bacterium]|jgi:AAA family ATP:ADP antiporter
MTSKFRKVLFPIENNEMKKFLSLAILMLLIIFCNTLLRNLKDTLIVMTNGAFSLAFVKTWFVLPLMFVFFFVYSKLSNHFQPSSIFCGIILAFMLVFAVFGFVIHPYVDFFKLTSIYSYLPDSFLHGGLYHLAVLIEYWPFTFFYFISELWSSVMISLLFWQFTNSFVSTDQAKRFYPLFGQIADFGMIMGGITLVLLSRETSQNYQRSWEHSFAYFTIILLVTSTAILFLYRYINKNIVPMDTEEKGNQTKKKTTLSIKDSLKHVANSPYLSHMAVMVLCFAVTSNLLEISWKYYIESYSETKNEFTTLLGYFSVATGVSTILLMSVGSLCLRFFGWRIGALIPPIFILISGLSFFSSVYLENFLDVKLQAIGSSFLFLVIVLGSLTNIFGKSIKYALFDPTKEMAYLPLDQESKVKGKAAVDVVGVRLGKSAGSLIQQGVFAFFTNFSSAFIYLLGTLVVMCLFWIRSINILSLLYKKRLEYSED